MAKDWLETLLAPKKSERITIFSYLKPYLFGIIAIMTVITFLTLNNDIKADSPSGAAVAEPTGDPIKDIMNAIIPPEKDDNSTQANQTGNPGS